MRTDELKNVFLKNISTLLQNVRERGILRVTR